jgi:hypothetical protein
MTHAPQDTPTVRTTLFADPRRRLAVVTLPGELEVPVRFYRADNDVVQWRCASCGHRGDGICPHVIAACESWEAEGNP